MQRIHVHLSVEDLAQSIRFYTALFGAEPQIVRADYAKWTVDDPVVNFAISTNPGGPAVDHLGIQVESAEALQIAEQRIRSAQQPMLESRQVHCCYASTEQAWVADPQGLLWEAFLTHAESATFCDGGQPVHELRERAEVAASGCCQR